MSVDALRRTVAAIDLAERLAWRLTLILRAGNSLIRDLNGNREGYDLRCEVD